MVIRDMKFTPVTVPFNEPEIWCGGGRKGVTSIIVEIFTDEGPAGVGESLPAPSPEITLAALANFKSRLIGENPFHIERIVNKLYSSGGFYAFATMANFA